MSREVKPAVVTTPVVEGEDQIVPLSRLRAAIGRRMAESKQTIPHFTVTRSADAERLLGLRKEINSQLPEGEKISVNDFIVKAAALALRQYPNLNTSLGNENLIQHAHVNIGIAVSVEGGLLTVVVRDADVKSLRQIAGESASAVARARQGKVRPEDIEGSTFSVSNLGMYEVDEFSAIINPPEAAILAVGSAKPQPVVRDGEIVAGTRMSMTLSVDHRISDGVEAAQFMQALATLLENPWRLVL
jgi:pyruvate dehydrogenase E2 component (dihydrolipoamide acetyltransferase)